MAYVYIKSQGKAVAEPFLVGFYVGNYVWILESSHATLKLAERRVNYLNGGKGESPKKLKK